MTGLLVGWKEETTYGVNAFTTPATDQAYEFGRFLEGEEFPVPGNDIDVVGVYQLGQVMPVQLVEKAKNVEFTLKFCPKHGYPWKWALGVVSGGATAVFKSSTAIPSLSIYFETDFGDWVYALGCVVQSMDFFGDKDLPMQISLSFIAAEVVHGTVLTNKTLLNPTSLAITDAWGWSDTDIATIDAHDVDPLDDPDIGGIQRILVHIANKLKKRVTNKVVEVKKVASDITMTLGVSATTVTEANEIVMACRNLETNDFQYKWSSGAYYWILNVNNWKPRVMKVTQKHGTPEVPLYTISGKASYNSTRTDEDTTYLKNPCAVKISDGSTYA